jgi:beta-glucosidase
MEAWYPGQEQGNAIANVLFGVVNPSGKLPETFPRAEADLPTNTPQQWPGVSVAGDAVGPHSAYSERLEVGYRWYDDRGIAPLFPFGHGLSYTTFAYSNLAVSSPSIPATVAFDVTNTGKVGGAEVAQVYVGAPPDNYAGEPKNQLRGYKKVSLAPGQTAHVSLPLDARAVSYWNTSTHSWTVETGCHSILVGSSSRDVRLESPGLCIQAAVAAPPQLPNTSRAAMMSPLLDALAILVLGLCVSFAIRPWRPGRRQPLASLQRDGIDREPLI